MINAFTPSAQMQSEPIGFYSATGWNDEQVARETRTESFFAKIIEKLSSNLSSSEQETMLMSAGLIDAISRVNLDKENETMNCLLDGMHAFNVFYRSNNSEPWRLIFANATYLESLGASLEEVLNKTSDELMNELYTPETINGFQNAASASGGYRSRFITMDKRENESGEYPSYFWYRKEFNSPLGGQIQIRLGMNGTSLDDSRRETLESIYTGLDLLRDKKDSRIILPGSDISSVINRVKAHAGTFAQKNNIKSEQTLRWMAFIMEMANDIIQNSPFPLTVLNKENQLIQVSPAYAAMVGYDVKTILEPGFFERIYPGMEGDLVREAVRIYKERGYYPKDIDFMATRGNVFENEFWKDLKHIQLRPMPYPFQSGDIRLNSASILEKLEF